MRGQVQTHTKAPTHSVPAPAASMFQTRPFSAQNTQDQSSSFEHDGSSLFERYLQRRAAGFGTPSTRCPERCAELVEVPVEGSPIIQRQENNTGLPDKLKTGIENLSGYAMDDISVHYNSAKPAQFQALAYTQGTDIHVAPGQERHLPHEAWHVVQQMQGRVRPTMQMKGVGVNDDVGLEREADVMGTKALQSHHFAHITTAPIATRIDTHDARRVFQRARVIQCVKLGERPFKDGYRPIVESSQWLEKAEEYEKRLGSYTYQHPKAHQALNAGIKRLKEVVSKRYQLESDNTKKKDTYQKIFFKDDPTSAGQVGLNLDIGEMLDVLDHGNLRERMTAFYNAAYYTAGFGNNLSEGFKAILHDIVFNNDWKLAGDLNLNEEALHNLSEFLNKSSWRSTVEFGTQIVTAISGKDVAYNFEKDVFALGNLSLYSSNFDSVDVTNSQKDRKKRSKSDQLKRKKTPQEYKDLGTPLSDREVKYLQEKDQLPSKDSITSKKYAEVQKSNLGTEEYEQWLLSILPLTEEEIYKDQKLPWLTGTAYYEISPDNSWYKKVHDQLRMPVVAGISGTTTRMLSTFKWLNTGVDPLDFRLAIMGWMLIPYDHSLYEILRGSHIAGVKGPDEDTTVEDPTKIYMNIPLLTKSELRNNVAESKLFPHELIYKQLAQEKDRQHNEHLLGIDPEIADEGVKKLAHAKRGAKNGPYNNVNEAHAIAITNYTSAVHSLLNRVIIANKIPYGLLNDEVVVRFLNDVVYRYFLNPSKRLYEYLMSIDVLKLKEAEIQFIGNSHNNMDERTKKLNEIYSWIEEHAKKLSVNLQTHVNMAVEGLNALPAVDNVTVWRGHWDLDVWETYTKGKTLQLDTFTSFSRKKAEAERFIEQGTLSHQILIKLELRGIGGKEIKDLSHYEYEDEVLLMPGSKIKITDTQQKGDTKVVEAIEVP